MTLQGAKVRKPQLAVSGVVVKGNTVVLDGRGSFILPNSCAGVAPVRKAITGVQGRIPLHAKNGVFVLRMWEPEDMPSAGSSLKRPSTRLRKPGPPVRPLKEKELGPFGELSTSNPGSVVPTVAPEVAPNVSARGVDDVDMGDEVAQRNVSHPESIGSDEVREPRHQNSPSDPTSRESEDHVLTGHASFRPWCAACVQGRGRAERHQGEGRKELEDGSKVPIVSWDYCFLGARNRISEADVKQRGDSPVLVMHDGVTKSIFAPLIPAKGVDLPSCEKVVKMIVRDLDTLGYYRVVFRCDNEPSILSLLGAVRLAWTGDVVQETSAEGDPQSNGAAESSVNVVKGHVRSIKLAVESASCVEVPAVHDLLTWLVSHATSMHRRVFGGSRGQDSVRKKCGEARLSPSGTVR